MAAPASSPVSAAIETTAVPSAGMVGTGGGAQDAVPGAPITTRTASLEDVASSGEARRVLRRLELLRALDLAFDEALRSPKLAPILLVHLRAAAAEVGLVLVDPDSLGRRGPRWLREEAGQAWEDLWLTWIQQLTAALGDPAAMGRGTLPLPGPAVWRRYLEARDAAPPPLAEVLLARVLAVSGALEAAGFAGWDDLLPGVGPAIVFRALYDDPLRFEWPRLDLLGEVGTRLRPALAEGQGLPDLRVVASRGLQAAEEGAKGPPDLADLLRALWRGEAEAVAKVRSPLFPDQADLRRVGERVLERYRAARNQALAEGGALVPGGDATERYLVEVIEGRLLPGIPARTEALAAGPVPQAPALDETIESAPSMMETTARGTGSEEASVAATSVSTAPALVPVGVPAVRPPSAPQSPSPSPAPSPSPPAAATPAPEEPAGSEDEVAEENPRGVGAGPSPEGGEEPAGHWWIQVRRAATRHPQRAGGVVLGALLLWALIRAVRRGRAGPTPREGTGKTTVLAISDETIPDVSGTQVSQPDQGSFDTIVESATPIPRSDVSPNRRTRGDDSAHGAWGAAAGEDGLAAGEVPTWLRHALQGALGERYDQYYLLGSGGMGCVVRAWDQRLHRQVAVKVPPPHLATDTHFRERFLREARALARLQHPNIAIVHDIPDVTAREIPVMILEYLEGQDLSEVLRAKGPLPLHDVAHWIDQAADGIQHAHDQGIFHRDLKPANLMVLHNGRLKVLDFGLASVGGHQRITRSGVLMGSLPYMAPEQMRGETVDARADVFSLGVTTYEILAGALPFHADDSGRLNPIPIERVRDDLPVEVVVVLRQVLGADPGRRFSSVQAFQRAFEKAAGLTPRRKLTTR